MQDLFMRCTLDSIFKVGFGVELNCLEGSNKEGSAFMKAFDESNALTYGRYVDPIWELKRYFSIGSEAALKKNIKVIDDFVNQLIKNKRNLLAQNQDCNGRCADIDDTLPDGFKVKKGDGVYYISYAMGRMPHLWGEDAEEFRPERWLVNGIFQPESPFKFIAFHGGLRICLGKDFAYRQMKILSIALLRFFQFKLADDTKKVTYRTMFTLHINGELPVCAVSRAAS
uniref:Cytochrome P450 n=1 Tax=Cannabis sativa TaxID=3483 RepID=A0A803R9V8_CANSA